MIVLDDEIRAIITRYVREVREEKIRSAWADVSYDHAGYDERITILRAVVY